MKTSTFIRSFAGRFTVALTGSALVLASVSGCTSSRTEEPTGTPAAGNCDNSAYESANIDWKQFSGETITVAALEHPWWNTVKPLLPCFEELTGIKTNASALGEDQYVSKVAVELSAGASDPDVFMINQFGQAAGSGWLEPLDGYLSNTKLSDPEWFAADDFFAGAYDFGKVGNDVMALPVTAEAQVLFIRDDLVSKAPKTLEELRTVAAEVTTDKVAGFGARAVAAANQTPWAFGGFAFTEGGEFVDASGKPQFDSAENIAALKLYADLLKNSGTAGASGWGYLENQQAMQQGSLAIWSDSSSLLGSLKDPEATEFADKINAYPFPSGSSGISNPNAWFWTIGINAKSEQKDAAWLFLQWATSKPISEAGAAQGASPARTSAWESSAVADSVGAENAERIKQTLESVDSAPLSNAWKLSEWNEMSDALARAVNAAVTGADAAAELKAAQAAAEQVAK